MADFAFVFDMDGVIVDSNPFHKAAIHRFCEKYNLHLTEEELKKKVYGRTNKEWLTQLFGKLSPEQLKAYADEKEALYREAYSPDIRPVAGLVDFLKKTKLAKIPVAIGTSAPRVNVEFTLKGTHTEKYFKVILDESDVSQGKPHPQIYLKAAEALGLDPGRCIVMEDSLSGVKAARAAGSKVVGITTTHSKEELRDTDFVISDFKGLEPEVLAGRLLPRI